MNLEDMIRMARKAGCVPFRHPEYDNDVQVFATPDVLERFAVLVAAAERERFNALLEDYHVILETLEEMQAAVTAEREACAKVCDVTIPGDEYATALINSYADAIRARGQA